MIKISDALYYRKVERSDLSKRVEWINDEEINKHLTFDFPVSLGMTEAWFSKVVLDSTKLNFTFFSHSTGEFVPIGFGGLINIDIKNRKAELFVTIGEKKFHGKGFGKEIVNFITSFGFNEIGLNKVYLVTLETNQPAVELYKKCGYKLEGTLRHHLFHRGMFRNALYMSILKSEVL